MCCPNPQSFAANGEFDSLPLSEKKCFQPTALLSICRLISTCFPVLPFMTDLNGRDLLDNGGHVLRAHLVQQTLHLAQIKVLLGWMQYLSSTSPWSTENDAALIGQHNWNVEQEPSKYNMCNIYHILCVRAIDCDYTACKSNNCTGGPNK